jgi:general secretion pathway protein G
MVIGRSLIKGAYMKAKCGFTLVEILIVVVILGVLAAMVIPVFGQASTDAKNSTVASNLMKMRLQIELYKNHHNGHYPGTGTASFKDAMTGKTDISGAAGTKYGPYLERIPANSFNGSDSIRLDGAAAGAGAGTDGWRFDTTTGDIRCDDSAQHAADL